MPELLNHETRQIVTALLLLLDCGIPSRNRAGANVHGELHRNATTNSVDLRHRRLPDHGNPGRRRIGPPTRELRGLPYYNGSPFPAVRRRHRHASRHRPAERLRFTDWYSQTGAILSNFSVSLDRRRRPRSAGLLHHRHLRGRLRRRRRRRRGRHELLLAGRDLSRGCRRVRRQLGLHLLERELQWHVAGERQNRAATTACKAASSASASTSIGNFLNQGDNTATGYGLCAHAASACAARAAPPGAG